MFKKIVSRLPFSPTFVAQLGPYARDLKKEDIIRKITLTFVILTVLVQTLLVLQPQDQEVNKNIITSKQHNYEFFLDEKLSPSIKITNMSQGFVDATSVLAKPNDLLSYTITVNNETSEFATARIEYPLYDALEYSTLLDSGGGKLKTETGVLSWEDAVLEPETSQTRTFVVKLLSSIPITASSKVNPGSYDCRIDNFASNNNFIDIECPVLKIAEQLYSELPKISNSNGLLISLTLLVVALYFHERTRLLKKEVRLIRKDSNTGTV